MSLSDQTKLIRIKTEPIDVIESSEESVTDIRSPIDGKINDTKGTDGSKVYPKLDQNNNRLEPSNIQIRIKEEIIDDGQCAEISSTASQVSRNTNRPTSEQQHRWLFEGSTVLARWKNGLFYLGVIQAIDINSNHVEVKYEDNTTYWTSLKDVHKQLSRDTIAAAADSDIICDGCRDGTSLPPNEIVICDMCNHGWHQRCHAPKIDVEVLEPNVPWQCRTCVFFFATREGGADPEDDSLTAMKRCLPYSLNQLEWIDGDLHRVNRQNTYCYCGGGGDFASKMLQCRGCRQWFHEACLQCLETPLLYGDHYFSFICALCNDGKEVATRLIMKWSDVVAIVIHNLQIRTARRFFELNTEIVQFIRNNAKSLKLSVPISELSFDQTRENVLRVLTNNPNRFLFGKETKRKSIMTWGLRAMKGAFFCYPPGPTVSSPPPPLYFKSDRVMTLSETPSTSSTIVKKEHSVLPILPPTKRPVSAKTIIPNAKKLKLTKPIKSTSTLQTKPVKVKSEFLDESNVESTSRCDATNSKAQQVSEETSSKSCAISSSKLNVSEQVPKRKEIAIIKPQCRVSIIDFDPAPVSSVNTNTTTQTNGQTSTKNKFPFTSAISNRDEVNDSSKVEESAQNTTKHKIVSNDTLADDSKRQKDDFKQFSNMLNQKLADKSVINQSLIEKRSKSIDDYKSVIKVDICDGVDELCSSDKRKANTEQPESSIKVIARRRTFEQSP